MMVIDAFNINKIDENIYHLNILLIFRDVFKLNLSDKFINKNLEFNNSNNTFKDLNTGKIIQNKIDTPNLNVLESQEIKSILKTLTQINIKEVLERNITTLNTINVSDNQVDDFYEMLDKEKIKINENNKELNEKISPLLLILKNEIIEEFYKENKKKIFKERPDLSKNTDKENLNIMQNSTFFSLTNSLLDNSYSVNFNKEKIKDVEELKKGLLSFLHNDDYQNHLYEVNELDNIIIKENGFDLQLLEKSKKITMVDIEHQQLLNLLKNYDDPKYVEAFKNSVSNIMKHELSHSFLNASETKAISMQTKSIDYQPFISNYKENKELLNNLSKSSIIFIKDLFENRINKGESEKYSYLKDKLIEDKDLYLFNKEAYSNSYIYGQRTNNQDSNKYYCNVNEYLNPILGFNIIEPENIIKNNNIKFNKDLLERIENPSLKVVKDSNHGIYLNIMLYTETLNLKKEEKEVIKKAISNKIVDNFFDNIFIDKYDLSQEEINAFQKHVSKNIEVMQEMAHNKYLEFKNNNKLDVIENLHKNNYLIVEQSVEKYFEFN